MKLQWEKHDLSELLTEPEVFGVNLVFLFHKNKSSSLIWLFKTFFGRFTKFRSGNAACFCLSLLFISHLTLLRILEEKFREIAMGETAFVGVDVGTGSVRR